MANEEQLVILKQGVEVWNKWRQENREIEIDLAEAELRGADLHLANLRKASLRKADLTEADLRRADLVGADLIKANLTAVNLTAANLTVAKLVGAGLRKADLSRVDLSVANLAGANLDKANLWGANLYFTNLSGASLSEVDLTRADLVNTKINKVKVSGSSVYGISVWDLEGEFEEQKDLVITPPGVPTITVDNIKVAQFVYLILNNEEIRDVLNTLTSKTVLILGRFAPSERKLILDMLKKRLREYDLLPIVFDFDRPTDIDFTETIKTLAGLSYFVIADITNPKSSPLELQATVPDYQIPFVPIIQEGEEPFSMLDNLQTKYNWVLDTLSYSSIETLIEALRPAIIDPAIAKHNELRLVKAREPRIRSAEDFIGDKGKE